MLMRRNGSGDRRNMPALGKELGSITADEQTAMEAAFQQAVEERLTEIRERKTRRI